MVAVIISLKKKKKKLKRPPYTEVYMGLCTHKLGLGSWLGRALNSLSFLPLASKPNTDPCPGCSEPFGSYENTGAMLSDCSRQSSTGPRHDSSASVTKVPRTCLTALKDKTMSCFLYPVRVPHCNFHYEWAGLWKW